MGHHPASKGKGKAGGRLSPGRKGTVSRGDVHAREEGGISGGNHLVCVSSRGLGAAKERVRKLKAMNDQLRIENRRLWLENAALAAKIKELSGIPQSVMADLKQAFDETCAAVGWDPHQFRVSKNSVKHSATRKQIIAAMSRRFEQVSVRSMARFLGVSRKTIYDAEKYGQHETTGELF